MELDPTLHAKSMDLQLWTLIYYRCVPTFIAPSTTSLSCYHGWMSQQGDPTVDSMTSVISDHRSTVIVSHRSQRFLIGSRPEYQRQFWPGIFIYSHSASHPRWQFWPRKRYWGVFTKWQEFHSVHVEHPWPGEGALVLISSCNDHRVSSPTLILYSNLWMPNSTVQWSSLRLYWSPIPRRFRTSTNCILNFFYLSI